MLKSNPVICLVSGKQQGIRASGMNRRLCGICTGYTKCLAGCVAEAYACYLLLTVYIGD
jgi:hypothetical protein